MIFGEYEEFCLYKVLVANTKLNYFGGRLVSFLR